MTPSIDETWRLMQPETPFRIAVLALLCLTMTIVGYHRWQAARSGERISRRDEGLLLAVSLRLAGLGMWAGTLAYLIAPGAIAWAQLPIPDWVRWLGACAGALFVGLIYWTLTNLGKNLTDTVMTRAGATLVTTGPYRLVRHPFYVSVGLLIFAVTLLSANLVIGICGALVLALLVVRTPTEEQKLIARFPDEYPAYMSRTPRFFPMLRPRAR